MSAMAVVDSSHMTASSSASWSSFSPPSNFVGWHVSTMCTIVSVTGHNHREVIGQDPFVQICKHGPWPVWKRLSRDHVSRDVVFVLTSRS